MIKHYLKSAFRNILKYKAYSAITISGLAIGLAVCMMIVLYVRHESGYDQFHTNAGRIYWMQTKIKLTADSLFMPYLNYAAAPTAAEADPTIESFLRLRKDPQNVIIQNKEQPSLKFSESKFLFADSNFFRFFSFPLLQGSKAQVLQQPMSVVISQNAAMKYFGSMDVIGKLIRYSNNYDFVVTGVAENPPSNSSIDFDFVASLSSMLSIKEEEPLIRAEKNDFTTYFLLRPGSDIHHVENTLFQIAKQHDNSDELNLRYISIPLSEVHLLSGMDTANLKYLKIFPYVAALVLLLALINYISLSTARSAIRVKEIGVRKVLGAGRKLVAAQFFIESALYTAIAFVLAYLLCLYTEPFFFHFLQISIDHSFLYDARVLISFAVLFVVTVLLASIYPAILLSAFKPITMFRTKPAKKGGATARKAFTVFQFGIAIAFIICGIVMQKQLRFFRHMDTGIDRENVVMIPFGKEMGRHIPAIKNDLRTIPGIQDLSIALHPLYKGYDMMGITPPGADQMILMPTLDVDQHFISLMNLKWKIPPADPFYYKNRNNIVINESAIEKLNLHANPLHEKVDQFNIAGVLKDFNWSSPEYKIVGLFVSVMNSEDSAALWTDKGGCLYAKLSTGAHTAAVIDQLKSEYNKYDAATPFEYYFLDDALDSLYKAESRLANILTVFTTLSIVIACLGLLGLVTFIAVQKTKEIGIRKVLGASILSIWNLLSREYLVLIAIAFLLAAPIAWLLMKNWLQNFAYRTSVDWWIFLATILSTISIALLTVSYQAIKAAIANPIKSLRSE